MDSQQDISSAMGAIGQPIAGIFAPAEDFWTPVRSTPKPTPEQMEAWRKANNLKQVWEITLSGLFGAATAWPLAEFFTRKRRMALRSIIISLAFVGGIFATVLELAIKIVENGTNQPRATLIALTALVIGSAC